MADRPQLNNPLRVARPGALLEVIKMAVKIYLFGALVSFALFTWGCYGWQCYAQARSQVSVLRAQLRNYVDAPTPFTCEQLQKIVEDYGYVKTDLIEVRPGRIILKSVRDPSNEFMRRMAAEIPAGINFTVVTK